MILIGRNLTPSPFLTTAIAFVEAVRGSAVGARWFPGIISGETVAAIAIDEGARHRPDAIALRAERSGNGFSLSGRKQFVVQGASADVILVAAQAQEGLTLFAVEKEASGLAIEGVRLADSSIGARITFDAVESMPILGRRVAEGGSCALLYGRRALPTRWSGSDRPRWT